MSYAREKRVAIEAVTRAAKLCIMVRANMVSPAFLEKGDKSPVTIADFGAQAVVCQLLLESFPNDVIVAEEGADELCKPQHAAVLDQVAYYVRQQGLDATRRDICAWIDAGQKQLADRYWTLDPIDGTKGFLRNDQYAIALALVEDGEVKIGALACPALPWSLSNPTSDIGVLFIAVRGEGAHIARLSGGSTVPIQVAANGASLRLVESVEAAHGDQRLQQAIAQAVGISEPALRIDSQAKYGMVARGDAALYLRLPAPTSPNYRENIWDHAAGTILVEEAGGHVTDINGYCLDFTTGIKLQNNRGVIVTNRKLHDAVLETLAHHSNNGA